MQGYLFVMGNDATGLAACVECVRNGNRSVEGRHVVWLGEDFVGTIPCTTCDVTIDGEFVEPKPVSWTVTVEVTVYHSEDEDLYTESDARDRVESALYDEFGDVRIVDSVEHFE